MVYIYLALAAVFWGGNYVVGKLMVVDTNPVLLSELRWFLTSILLIAFNFSQLKFNKTLIRDNLGVIFPLAILGQILFPVTLYIGLQYTSSLNAAIYLSATPAIVLTINYIVFRDEITKSNILGVIISTLGVAWLITQGKPADLEFLHTFNKGDAWTIISALSWGFYCSFLRKKPKELSGNIFVTSSAVVGAIILLPFSGYYLYRGTDIAITWSLGTVAGLAYLVIFPSWLSYLLWTKGISAIGATRGEIFTHLIPLSAGLLSIIFLGTKLSTYHIESVIAIAIGVFLCSRHSSTGINKKATSAAASKQ